mmetsp:Transcript_14782/g.30507  ORF Transcript_14782/g.30507 Transcript_14782/m.30507 type:complete len:486 (+) Transcript_14782:2141-3598(+)
MVFQYFGCYIARCPASRHKGLRCVHPLGEAKVANLDGRIAVLRLQKNVLRFNVSVHDTVFVHVLDCPQQDFCEIAGILFRVIAQILDAIKDVPSGHEFHDDVIEILFFEKIDDPDQVFVVKLVHDGHFLKNLLVGFVVSLDDLHGKILAMHLRITLVHETRGTSMDFFLHFVQFGKSFLLRERHVQFLHRRGRRDRATDRYLDRLLFLVHVFVGFFQKVRNLFDVKGGGNGLHCRLDGALGIELLYFSDAAGQITRRQVLLPLPKPRIGQGCVGIQPFCGVHGQQHRDELFGLKTHVAPVGFVEGEIGTTDFSEHSSVRVVLEGRVPANNHVNQASHAPHVDLRVVVFPNNNLRGHKGRCPAPRFESSIWNVLCETKIGHQYRGIIVPALKQEILRFQVPVADFPLVHLPHGFQESDRQDPCVHFRIGNPLRQTIEHVASLGKELHNVKFFWCDVNVYQLNDIVDITHILHDADFAKGRKVVFFL